MKRSFINIKSLVLKKQKGKNGKESGVGKMNNKNNLAEKLMQLRESRRYSKTEVAERLGLNSLSTYANWEYGTREPDSKTLIKIAALYNVSVDYLLGVTNIPNPMNEPEGFLSSIEDPELKRWVVELANSEKEDLDKLKMMWDIIKQEKN